MEETPLTYATQLHESLQELIGLHHQLWESVRLENEALSLADVKRTYEATSSKEALIHWIIQAETDRIRVVERLASKMNLTAPSLKEIIYALEGSKDSNENQLAQQLNKDLNTLVILVERIKKQNASNLVLVEASLKNVGWTTPN